MSIKVSASEHLRAYDVSVSMYVYMYVYVWLRLVIAELWITNEFTHI